MRKLIGVFLVVASFATSFPIFVDAKSPWEKLHNMIDRTKEKYEEAKEEFNEALDNAKLK